VLAARSYFAHLAIDRYALSQPKRFRKRLDDGTLGLVDAFPKHAASWGLARKLLNVFLRECLYTSLLADEYRLAVFEPHLELPLDSITSGHLRRRAGRGRLSTWPGIKHLTPVISDEYQEFAQLVAADYGLARIHLDAIWWSREDELSPSAPAGS
jgi:hypothetical protein